MRLAVTGALGGLGANVVRTAIAQGHSGRALVRREPTEAALRGVEWVRGDARDVEVMAGLVRGCDGLAHCANVNISGAWAHEVLAMLDAAIAGCKRHAVRLIFPANVWVFGRGSKSERVDELRPFAPCSIKGAARVEQERRIRSSGIPYAMLRLPEFYGPNVVTLTGPMFREALANRTVRWFGRLDAEVEFVYMPDAARALVELSRSTAAERQIFHFPGVATTTPRAFLAEVVRQADSTSAVRGVPPWLIRSVSPFSPMARSFSDLLHLWEDPILLDGRKFAETFGPASNTAYAEGIAATLAWVRSHADTKMYY